MTGRRAVPGAVLVSGLAAGLTLAVLPVTGTAAAWNDQAAVSSPVSTSTSVPRPALSCVEVGRDAVVSWPQGTLPGAGTPAVEYLARVYETDTMLAVSGAGVRSVTVTPASVTPAASGEIRTVQVRAAVDFGSTTWVAAAAQQVVVNHGRGGTAVGCA